MNKILVTLDTDWAPDFAIDEAARLLSNVQVPATWFATHDCPAVRRLETTPELFEVGVHPNFLTGSTHGHEPVEVMDRVMTDFPNATSVRTHGLVQSTQLLDLMITRFGLKVDCSMFLPRTSGLKPFEYFWRGYSFWRLPFFWEDDFEMERTAPCFELDPYIDIGDGTKVFNFHPIHICLNSSTMARYYALKKAVPNLREATLADLQSLTNTDGPGVKTLFIKLVEHLSKKPKWCGGRVTDFVAQWRAQLKEQENGVEAP